MGGDAENGPKRWLGCRLGLRYVSFFYSICSYSITYYFFFFFFFTDTSVTYEDRAGNGQQRGEWSLRRQDREWVAMQRTGPNDG